METTCPDCGGSLCPLFTSFFCPNDCDRPTGQARRREFIRDGVRWWVVRVEANGLAPKGTTHGWTLCLKGSQSSEDPDLSLDELVRIHSGFNKSWWPAPPGHQEDRPTLYFGLVR